MHESYRSIVMASSWDSISYFTLYLRLLNSHIEFLVFLLHRTNKLVGNNPDQCLCHCSISAIVLSHIWTQRCCLSSLRHVDPTVLWIQYLSVQLVLWYCFNIREFWQSPYPGINSISSSWNIDDAMTQWRTIRLQAKVNERRWNIYYSKKGHSGMTLMMNTGSTTVCCNHQKAWVEFRWRDSEKKSPKCHLSREKYESLEKLSPYEVCRKWSSLDLGFLRSSGCCPFWRVCRFCCGNCQLISRSFSVTQQARSIRKDKSHRLCLTRAFATGIRSPNWTAIISVSTNIWTTSSKLKLFCRSTH